MSRAKEPPDKALQLTVCLCAPRSQMAGFRPFKRQWANGGLGYDLTGQMQLKAEHCYISVEYESERGMGYEINGDCIVSVLACDISMGRNMER